MIVEEPDGNELFFPVPKPDNQEGTGEPRSDPAGA
jgi:hypothetical protein